MYHIPVLLKESVEGLDIRPDGIYVDATFGSGGHSGKILEQLATGKLFAFDADKDALSNAPEDTRFELIGHNFRYLKNFLRVHGITRIDGILADLGISSWQIDQPDRGFSTRFSGRLDMRMDRGQQKDAWMVLNEYSPEDLEKVLKEYGEVENAYRLSREIISSRPFNTTEEFKSLVSRRAPKGKENQYLAKVFQAIRIEVNDELEALKELLLHGTDLLNPGGRFVVISYHSLEDRLVKNYFRTGNFEGAPVKDFYGNLIAPLAPVTRKAIIPSAAEQSVNSRSRSAKLRIAKKV